VLGNLLVIVLETVVVSIQTTRLVLFEFFARFFTGKDDSSAHHARRTLDPRWALPVLAGPAERRIIPAQARGIAPGWSDGLRVGLFFSLRLGSLGRLGLGRLPTEMRSTSRSGSGSPGGRGCHRPARAG